jgi:hypothetical protein
VVFSFLESMSIFYKLSSCRSRTVIIRSRSHIHSHAELEPHKNDTAPQSWLPECRIIRHPDSPVPDWNNLTMPEPVRYRNKAAQSDIFWPGTGLRWQMPECRCRRKFSRCRCPPMVLPSFIIPNPHGGGHWSVWPSLTFTRLLKKSWSKVCL